jgi:hypothetical protein
MSTSAEHNVDQMTEGLIAKTLEGVRDRIARAENERAEVERAIAAAREEERLLVRLLALRSGVMRPDDVQQLVSPHLETLPGEQQDHIQPGGDSKHPALEAVVRELAAAERPLHISELMRLLRDQQVRIPGAGTQANLITHLRRDSRLVRPSRGMYGLSAWGLENVPTTIRRKRKRSRVRSKADTRKTEL